MSTDKSEKELAYLQDLFIAPDWGERFAELIDQHLSLPDKGKVLYVNAGAGGHAITLKQRGSDELELVCVDESEECLELARAKAATAQLKLTFVQSKAESLDLADEEFDLVIGDASLAVPNHVRPILVEMVRVAVTGGNVAIILPTSSSFGEFFSIYWEALHNCGFADYEHDVENLITQLPAVSDVEQLAAREGLEDVNSWTQIEEFDYQSAEDFLHSTLISDFLMENWLKSIPERARNGVSEEIARIINEDRHDAEFSLTVKATLVVGKKADLPLAG